MNVAHVDIDAGAGGAGQCSVYVLFAFDICGSTNLCTGAESSQVRVHHEVVGRWLPKLRSAVPVDIGGDSVIGGVQGRLEFRRKDFLSPRALVQRLGPDAPPTDVVAHHIRQLLSQGVRDQVDSAKNRLEVTDHLLHQLASDFNRMLNGPLIWSDSLRSHVKLRNETAELLEEVAKYPVDTRCLNRLILEDALRGEIRLYLAAAARLVFRFLTKIHRELRRGEQNREFPKPYRFALHVGTAAPTLADAGCPGRMARIGKGMNHVSRLCSLPDPWGVVASLRFIDAANSYRNLVHATSYAKGLPAKGGCRLDVFYLDLAETQRPNESRTACSSSRCQVHAWVYRARVLRRLGLRGLEYHHPIVRLGRALPKMRRILLLRIIVAAALPTLLVFLASTGWRYYEWRQEVAVDLHIHNICRDARASLEELALCVVPRRTYAKFSDLAAGPSAVRLVRTLQQIRQIPRRFRGETAGSSERLGKSVLTLLTGNASGGQYEFGSADRRCLENYGCASCRDSALLASGWIDYIEGRLDDALGTFEKLEAVVPRELRWLPLSARCDLLVSLKRMGEIPAAIREAREAILDDLQKQGTSSPRADQLKWELWLHLDHLGRITGESATSSAAPEAQEFLDAHKDPTPNAPSIRGEVLDRFFKASRLNTILGLEIRRGNSEGARQARIQRDVMVAKVEVSSQELALELDQSRAINDGASAAMDNDLKTGSERYESAIPGVIGGLRLESSPYSGPAGIVAAQLRAWSTGTPLDSGAIAGSLAPLFDAVNDGTLDRDAAAEIAKRATASIGAPVAHSPTPSHPEIHIFGTIIDPRPNRSSSEPSMPTSGSWQQSTATFEMPGVAPEDNGHYGLLQNGIRIFIEALGHQERSHVEITSDRIERIRGRIWGSLPEDGTGETEAILNQLTSIDAVPFAEWGYYPSALAQISEIDSLLQLVREVDWGAGSENAQWLFELLVTKADLLGQKDQIEMRRIDEDSALASLRAAEDVLGSAFSNPVDAMVATATVAVGRGVVYARGDQWSPALDAYRDALVKLRVVLDSGVDVRPSLMDVARRLAVASQFAEAETVIEDLEIYRQIAEEAYASHPSPTRSSCRVYLDVLAAIAWERERSGDFSGAREEYERMDEVIGEHGGCLGPYRDQVTSAIGERIDWLTASATK